MVGRAMAVVTAPWAMGVDCAVAAPDHDELRARSKLHPIPKLWISDQPLSVVDDKVNPVTFGRECHSAPHVQTRMRQAPRVVSRDSLNDSAHGEAA